LPGLTRSLWTVALLASLAGASAPAADSGAIGSIEGEVTLKLRPPRRSASRYPGRRAKAHPVQALPAVAYLRGRVEGAAARGPSAPPSMAQRDTAFAPGVLTIQVGTSVRFPNQDPFFHNVFSYSKTERFDLGRYPKGQAKSVVFDEPGIVNVYCEVHEFMRAAIIVTENPFSAVVGEDGRFVIEGVPPGEYTLVVWHADLGTVEETVVVPDGGAARVSVELG
jgi:plastocyanin